MALALCTALAAQHGNGLHAQPALGAVAPAATGVLASPAAAATAPPGSSPAPTAAPSPDQGPTPVPVSVDKDGFHPSTVRVYSGQEVQWTNDDPKVTHTATAADGSWDTGPIEPGHSQIRQFFEPGKWDYVDGFNPALRAVLIVATPSPSTGTPAPAAASPSPPPSGSP